MSLHHVNALITNMATSTAGLITFEGGGQRRRTFADVYQDVVAAAHMFRHELNLSPRDRLGIAAGNSYAYVVADLAAITLGVIVVPIDRKVFPDLSVPAALYELSAILTKSPVEGVTACPVRPIDDVLTAPPAPSATLTPYAYQRGDVFAMKFTSGSTNLPKAIEARVENVNQSIDNVQKIYQHGPADRVLVFLPLDLLQQRYWIYSAILFGYELVLTQPLQAISQIGKIAPTVIMGVPDFFTTMWDQYQAYLGDHPRARRRDRVLRWIRKVVGRKAARLFGETPLQAFLGGQVRYAWTGSAPCPTSLIERYDASGVDLFQGYGMNETCIVTKNHPGASKIGSCGRVLPGYKVWTADDGEILVYSDNRVNDSYYKADAETNDASFRTDGTVKTGDLGHIDQDGFLYITGRKKDLIALSSGKKVVARRVEEALCASPLIRNCMVVGSGRPYCVAVLELAQNDLTGAEVTAEIHRINEGLLPEERVHRHTVAPEGFSIENNLLTNQYKLRRKDIQARYAGQINALYG